MDIQIDPKLFHEFHFKIAMPLKLPLTSRKILEEFGAPDVNTEAVTKIVQRNQYFEHMLIHEIKALGMKENTPTLKAAIALLGMSRARDFICALQVHRMVSRKHPEFGKDGKLNLKASDMLKYALKTEEYASLRKQPFADICYSAGMMFDLMVEVGKELFEAHKSYYEFVSEVYKHGMRTAVIAVEISKSFKTFPLSKYVFAAGLIHDIGKLAMELIYPVSSANSYQSFRNELIKKPVSREVRHFIEAKRFGLTHDYYSSQLAYYYQVFKPIERAILFHHGPYTLKTSNKELYLFSSVLALANNMAHNFRAPKDAADPVFKSWLTPELKDFKIDNKVLMMTMTKLGRESF